MGGLAKRMLPMGFGTYGDGGSTIIALVALSMRQLIKLRHRRHCIGSVDTEHNYIIIGSRVRILLPAWSICR